jgi:hypothetical protein
MQIDYNQAIVATGGQPIWIDSSDAPGTMWLIGAQLWETADPAASIPIFDYGQIWLSSGDAGASSMTLINGVMDGGLLSWIGKVPFERPFRLYAAGYHAQVNSYIRLTITREPRS